MSICDVCRYEFKEYLLDDPLHLTNWNLPNKRTANVCSVECQQILFAHYELDQRLAVQKVRGRTLVISAAVDRVRAILQETASVNLNDQEIRTLYYKLRDALDLDEDD